MVTFSGDLLKHAGKMICFVSIFKDKSIEGRYQVGNGGGKKCINANKKSRGNCKITNILAARILFDSPLFFSRIIRGSSCYQHWCFLVFGCAKN
jgi:hypothetical protein